MSYKLLFLLIVSIIKSIDAQQFIVNSNGKDITYSMMNLIQLSIFAPNDRISFSRLSCEMYSDKGVICYDYGFPQGYVNSSIPSNFDLSMKGFTITGYCRDMDCYFKMYSSWSYEINVPLGHVEKYSDSCRPVGMNRYRCDKRNTGDYYMTIVNPLGFIAFSIQYD